MTLEREGHRVTPAETPMDFDRAVREFGDDRDAIQHVAELFVKEGVKQLGAIRQAVETGDADWLQREAHKLKGGALSLLAGPLAEIAKQLESHARMGRVDESWILIEQLGRELARLDRFLEGLSMRQSQ